MKNFTAFEFKVDKENNCIHVKRVFKAPIDLVWAAWTEAELLDQWWAPKPYKALTKSLNFTPGGRWHYCMVGPDGDKQWCLLDYETIVPEKNFSGWDAFCDENQNISQSKPSMHWNNTFSEEQGNTTVNMQIGFKAFEDLETILHMGFKEGFAMGLDNLDQYIAAQFYLRRQKKPNNQTRVSTYLNFDGHTETAFLFYRSVFKTEFVKGLQRFGDIPHGPNQPKVPDNIKSMVLHVELPLMGGHVLMGTDALKEMGFTIKPGNNMHIHLEPESREEADRIFHALSAEGVVEMPMADMFFGAYFGSFTDKFGINWMINVQHTSK